MAIQFNNTRIEIDGVQSIVISPIQPDANSTAYVRLVQIYTDPSTVANRRPIIELYLVGGDQTVTDQMPLEIQIPGGLEF